MEITVQAKLLTAESKPYAFNGNEGTSHRIRLSVDGEIYVCKSSAEDVLAMARYEGQEGEATFKVTSRKENLGLELVSFKPETA